MNVIYYYPRCTTCKKAIKHLDKLGINYEKKDIVESKLNIKEIKYMFKLFGGPIKKMFNTSGIVYKELNLKEKLETITEAEKLQLLASNGMLIKRPLLILDSKIIIGYKEQIYDELITKE